tara:strand:+ start:62 stop:664 length:603 start_codon:yes stop_codon:yes gene_type:complete
VISHKYKCIYIHIPKTGGRSIELSFIRDLGLKRNSYQVYSELDLKPDGEIGEKLIKDGIIIGECYAHKSLNQFEIPINYISFASTRDPIKRAISFYEWIGYERFQNFDDFCLNLNKFKKNNWWEIMTRKQIDFIFDKNGQIADKIIDINDISEFCKKNFNLIIPHVNKSRITMNSKDISKRSIKILRKFYEKDFEMLGYK